MSGLEGEGPDLGEVSHTELRLHNHQVAVKDLVGGRADSLHNHRANGDVGDESAVHHIDVDPIASSGVNGLDLCVKT